MFQSQLFSLKEFLIIHLNNQHLSLFLGQLWLPGLLDQRASLKSPKNARGEKIRTPGNQAFQSMFTAFHRLIYLKIRNISELWFFFKFYFKYSTVWNEGLKLEFTRIVYCPSYWKIPKTFKSRRDFLFSRAYETQPIILFF